MNVRASHGLAGMMQSFWKRLTSDKLARFFVVSRFGFCQQDLSADFSHQQIRFWSADFSSYQICNLSADSVKRFLKSAVSILVRGMSHVPTDIKLPLIV
jgi:hypothetical protein